MANLELHLLVIVFLRKLCVCACCTVQLVQLQNAKKKKQTTNVQRCIRCNEQSSRLFSSCSEQVEPRVPPHVRWMMQTSFDLLMIRLQFGAIFLPLLKVN